MNEADCVQSLTCSLIGEKSKGVTPRFKRDHCDFKGIESGQYPKIRVRNLA
jgi:hypothetical protein